MVHLSAGWDWDSRRPDPCFQDLLRRMNFPPQGRPRPLAPHFLRAPPMRFRSVNAQSLNPECESWQPPFKPNHLIRCPFDADAGGTK